MTDIIPNRGLTELVSAIVQADTQVRLHSSSPGNNGTSNRIGIVAATIPHGTGWTTPLAGIVTCKTDINFGVISTTNNVSVAWISLWQNNNFIGAVSLQSSVLVRANQSFTVTKNTLKWQVQDA